MNKPILQAMVLADHVYQDRATGKHIIAGTFSTIYFAKRRSEPTKNSDGEESQTVSGMISTIGSPYLYLALVELGKDVPLSIKYVELVEDPKTLIEANIVVSANDPLSVAEFIISMPPLPAQRAGTFSLDVEFEGLSIGSWRVRVCELPSKDKETDD